MNNIIKYASLLLPVLLLLGGCNKETEQYKPASVTGQMNIASSVESIVLEKESADESAMIFSWGKAADRGADTELVYYFRFKAAEVSGLSSEPVRMDEGVRSISWTVRQINDMIYDWGFYPGMEVAVQAQIIAVVASSREYMLPEVSSTVIKITGYDPNPQPNFLSLVINTGGDDSFITLEEIAVGSDVFYWTGELQAGSSIRFVRDRNEPWPAYVQGETAGTLSLKDETEGEDDVIEITTTATYVVTANIANMKYIAKSVFKLPNGFVAVVGDAVRDAKWDVGAAIRNCQLKQQDLKSRPEVWSYTGYFNRGGESAFKITIEDGWNAGFWAISANLDPTHGWTQTMNYNDGDRKWQLPANFVDGMYTLELDLHTQQVRLVK